MIWLYSLITIAVLVLFVVIRRKRRNKKSHYLGHDKHPTGHLKYHEKTSLRVRSSRTASDKNQKDENNNQVAVLRFEGDIKASDRDSFSRLVDEVVLNKERFSETVVVVQSPGGSVAEYGFLFSEVVRLREATKKLTVCVDTVAASGGYLMALPAHHIVAAPFSMVGSIGVVSFIPNIRGLLEKLNIEPRTFTAGNFKRTVTLTDKASEEEKAIFQSHLELIHQQFKDVLQTYRPNIDVSRVATGEAWLAATSQKLNLGLVDQLGTSSQYLFQLNETQELVEFSETIKKTLLKKVLPFLQTLAQDSSTHGQPAYLSS